MHPREPGSVIHQRYEVKSVLGQGGFATTYHCQDAQTGKAVALKELHFARVQDWKSVDLFEREAKILAGLSHPRIPAYLDFFRLEEDDNLKSFCLVQELAPGKSLAMRLKESHPFQPDEVKGILVQVLDILTYLHGHSPPIIHRDLKPGNLVVDEHGAVRLVDFGAVRNRSDATGSTVAGTFGYMAPEQFQGKATPASDIYALAATALHLLSGKSPDALPTKRLKIDFSNAIQVDPDFALWLGQCLEPVGEDRPGSAAAARALLVNPPRAIQEGPRASAPVVVGPPMQRGLVLVAGIAAVLVAGAVAFVLVATQARPPDPIPLPPPALPDELEADEEEPIPPPPEPSNFCSPVPEGRCIVQCVVDFQAGTENCTNDRMAFRGDVGSGQGRVNMDLQDARGAAIKTTICNPKGWTFHVSDSPTGNGFGGDRGTHSNDAELHITGQTLLLYGSDYVSSRVLHEDKNYIEAEGCSERSFWIEDGRAQASEPCMTVQSEGSLRIFPPEDAEGKPDGLWHVGLNRSFASSARKGTGLVRAEFCIR
jgi:serine/threonine protein kinase